MGSTTSKVLRSVAVVAAFGMLAAACGSSSPSGSSTGSSSTTSGGSGGGGTPTASAPGITANSITIGSHQPLTGPAAPGYSEIAPAANALFQYVNSKGGVHGRQIKYTYEDDAYNPSQTTTVVRKLVLQDNVFAIFNGLGTPTHSAVEAFLNSEKVPDLFVASGCICWDQPSKYPYTSGWQTDYIREGKILGQYIKQSLSGKKVGYVYQNDDFGQDGIKGLDYEIPASDVVTKQPYDVNNINVGPQVAALQAKGAQVVALYTIPAFTALVLLQAAKIGYHPTWVVSSVGSDPPTLSGLLTKFSSGKAGGSLLTGMVTGTYLPALNDTSNPWIALFKKIHDQYIPTLPWDGNVLYGESVGYTFVRLMDQAGVNPTRDSVIKTLHSADLGGPGIVPFAFSSGSNAGFTGEQIAVNKDGSTLVPQGSVYTTDDSSSAPSVSNYTQPQPPSNLNS